MITPPLFSKLYNLEKQEPRSCDFDLNEFLEFSHTFSNPHQNIGKIIHVAGTNGKGSVCEILSQALTLCGYKTGLYTSPHIKEVNERIKIDNISISDNDFLKLERIIFDKIQSKTISYRTFFEAITMMAFLYFEQHKTDFSILETGMGGRLDSTNIVHPDVSVITIIDFDHTHILGNSLEDIAFEKAGIIKEKIPVFSFCQSACINKVIKAQAKKMHAPFTCVNRKEIKHFKNSFSFRGREISTPLNTYYQHENAALAAEILSHFNIEEKQIKHALSKISIKGRFQLISESPTIIIDGSHNPSAIETTLKETRRLFPQKELYTLSVFMQDKDLQSNLSLLNKYADHVLISTIPFFRAANLAHYKEMGNINYFDSLEKAFFYFDSNKNNNSMLLVTGSFYTLDLIKNIIHKNHHLL